MESRESAADPFASGDRALLEVAYDELRTIARRFMSRERREHTLQATALVNEAFLRLSNESVSWEDRRQLCAAVNEAMRRILIEHARGVGRIKRGGGMKRVTLGLADAAVELPIEDSAALYDAIDRLEREDPRAAAVTRLRFLTGLDVEETAEALAISVRTVHREWRFARAWLFDRLSPE